MLKLVSFALVMSAALTGCKDKGKDKPAAPTATEPSAKPTGPATAVGAQTPAAAAPASLIVAGEINLGCVGWSDKLRTAACLTGQMGMGVEPEVLLSSVGKAPLADKIAFDPFARDLQGHGNDDHEVISRGSGVA